jgi:hypothetical protein
MSRKFSTNDSGGYMAFWEITIALFLIATGYATFLMILMNIFGANA